MKSVLAFLLLIAISCQIGQGDSAPDTMYSEFKEMLTDGLQYAKETYNEYINPIMPEIPSVSVPDPLKDGYKKIKDGMENMAKGAGEMVEDTVNSIPKAMDYV